MSANNPHRPIPVGATVTDYDDLVRFLTWSKYAAAGVGIQIDGQQDAHGAVEWHITTYDAAGAAGSLDGAHAAAPIRHAGVPAQSEPGGRCRPSRGAPRWPRPGGTRLSTTTRSAQRWKPPRPDIDRFPCSRRRVRTKLG